MNTLCNLFAFRYHGLVPFTQKDSLCQMVRISNLTFSHKHWQVIVFRNIFKADITHMLYCIRCLSLTLITCDWKSLIDNIPQISKVSRLCGLMKYQQLQSLMQSKLDNCKCNQWHDANNTTLYEMRSMRRGSVKLGLQQQQYMQCCGQCLLGINSQIFTNI